MSLYRLSRSRTTIIARRGHGLREVFRPDAGGFQFAQELPQHLDEAWPFRQRRVVDEVEFLNHRMDMSRCWTGSLREA